MKLKCARASGAWRQRPPGVVLGSAAAFGQANTGAIVGTIHDASGAVMPGVRHHSKRRNQQRATVVTTASGDYSAPLLPPGSYEVSAEIQGFNKSVFRNVQLQVNQTVRTDFVLTLSSVQEEVSVTAAAPLLQTDTSSMGQVVGQVQIATLPLNERNFVSFAYLAPGVQIDAEQTGVQPGAGAQREWRAANFEQLPPERH